MAAGAAAVSARAMAGLASSRHTATARGARRGRTEQGEVNKADMRVFHGGVGTPAGKQLAMSARRKQATRPVGLRTAERRRVWVGSAVSHACLVNGMITVYKMNGQSPVP
ncbi:hypothetical protein D3C81_2056760 [compost metagenome]